MPDGRTIERDIILHVVTVSSHTDMSPIGMRNFDGDTTSGATTSVSSFKSLVMSPENISFGRSFFDGLGPTVSDVRVLR